MIQFFICLVLLVKVQADKCGNNCSYTQVCGDDGTCYKKSDVISCRSSFGYLRFNSHYCLKTQACCGDGCMPKGSVCCTHTYCESDQTCCPLSLCCREDKKTSYRSTSYKFRYRIIGASVGFVILITCVTACIKCSARNTHRENGHIISTPTYPYVHSNKLHVSNPGSPYTNQQQQVGQNTVS